MCFFTADDVFGADGSYDDLLRDPSIECMHVGNVYAFRRTVGEKCLMAN